MIDDNLFTYSLTLLLLVKLKVQISLYIMLDYNLRT